MTAQNLLSLDDLYYRYREAPSPALDGVSLTVRAGETLALVGESGSGKSTLARALAGLLPVVGESARFDGVSLPWQAERRSSALRRRIQIVFQNPDRSLNPMHSVATILSRPLSLLIGLTAAARARRVAELLEQVRLPAAYAERYPAELSGGERQRVAIARALAAEPSLLICDEVTSALDVSVQAAILDVLRDLKSRTGLSILFITHDLAVVRWFADRVAVLYRGVICEVGPVSALFGPVRHPYTHELISAVSVIGRRIERFGGRTVLDQEPAGQGCRFANRCSRSIEGLCATLAPPWREPYRMHTSWLKEAVRCDSKSFCWRTRWTWSRAISGIDASKKGGLPPPTAGCGWGWGRVCPPAWWKPGWRDADHAVPA